MSYEFITERDCYTTPVRYGAYLRDTYAAAKRTLEKPEQQWPRGSSHVISRGIMAECESAYANLAIEFGLYDAHGKLAGYAT